MNLPSIFLSLYIVQNPLGLGAIQYAARKTKRFIISDMCLEWIDFPLHLAFVFLHK